MMVILWWNLSKDESYLVMKVMIVNEVMTGDVSPVAMFSLHRNNTAAWFCNINECHYKIYKFFFDSSLIIILGGRTQAPAASLCGCWPLPGPTVKGWLQSVGQISTHPKLQASHCSSLAQTQKDVLTDWYHVQNGSSITDVILHIFIY